MVQKTNLWIANTKEYEWLLQPELKAVNEGLIYVEEDYETFTYKGCGLNDNDRVKDEITKKVYIYKSDGRMVEVDEWQRVVQKIKNRGQALMAVA